MMMKRKSTQSQDLKLSEVVPFLAMALLPFLPHPRVLTGQIFHIKVQCWLCPKKFKKCIFTTHFLNLIHLSMLLGRRPSRSGLRFSKFQNFLCTKLGTTEFVKFGPLPVYWQQTPTGNIKFFQLKLGKKFVKCGIRTHAYYRTPRAELVAPQTTRPT